MYYLCIKCKSFFNVNFFLNVGHSFGQMTEVLQREGRVILPILKRARKGSNHIVRRTLLGSLFKQGKCKEKKGKFDNGLGI